MALLTAARRCRASATTKGESKQMTSSKVCTTICTSNSVSGACPRGRESWVWRPIPRIVLQHLNRKLQNCGPEQAVCRTRTLQDAGCIQDAGGLSSTCALLRACTLHQARRTLMCTYTTPSHTHRRPTACSQGAPCTDGPDPNAHFVTAGSTGHLCMQRAKRRHQWKVQSRLVQVRWT